MYPLLKTFRSLFKVNLWGLMFACAVLAVAVVLGAAGMITWVTNYFVHIKMGWLDMIFNGMIASITGIAGWFMMPALIVLIAGMFQEKAIYRVETVYYPDFVSNEEPKFWPDAWHDIKFTLWALFLNILIIPLNFFGIGFILSIILNSYIIGREFFESAAGYHLGKKKAKELSQQNKKVILGGGLVITLMALIPLLNLFTPIVAIVWMVHVFHNLYKR
ncbi:MAG: hypothetical protein C4518_10755 [Desulfobacteraceae bacterium]|nr:MAG: hypothetical protein C4518_10755 [Desulfobacteraceae bacterium]